MSLSVADTKAPNKKIKNGKNGKEVKIQSLTFY